MKKEEIGKFIFKYHKGKLQTICSMYFSMLNQKHKYGTRLKRRKTVSCFDLI